MPLPLKGFELSKVETDPAHHGLGGQFLSLGVASGIPHGLEDSGEGVRANSMPCLLDRMYRPPSAGVKRTRPVLRSPSRVESTLSPRERVREGRVRVPIFAKQSTLDEPRCGQRPPQPDVSVERRDLVPIQACHGVHRRAMCPVSDQPIGRGGGWKDAIRDPS